MIAMLAKRGDKRAVIPSVPSFLPANRSKTSRTVSSKFSLGSHAYYQLIGR